MVLYPAISPIDFVLIKKFYSITIIICGKTNLFRIYGKKNCCYGQSVNCIFVIEFILTCSNSILLLHSLSGVNGFLVFLHLENFILQFNFRKSTFSVSLPF